MNGLEVRRLTPRAILWILLLVVIAVLTAVIFGSSGRWVTYGSGE